MNTAPFIFANLGSDVVRCVSALQTGNLTRYHASLGRAHKTLALLRKAERPEAYEEGLLLMRGLHFAREQGTLESFSANVNSLIGATLRM